MRTTYAIKHTIECYNYKIAQQIAKEHNNCMIVSTNAIKPNGDLIDNYYTITWDDIRSIEI